MVHNRRLRSGVLALVTLLAIGCSGAGQATSGGSTTGNPGVDLPMSTAAPAGTSVPAADRIRLTTTTTTEYFTVYGSNADEIFAYIAAKGPLDDTGTHASGLTIFEPGLDWVPVREGAACSIASMNIQANLRVILPALDNPSRLPAALQANWNKFFSTVAAHEQKHVDIWLKGVATIRDQMIALQPASSCSSLAAAISNVWTTGRAASEAEQETFHAGERARVEAAAAPIKAQVEANRKRLDAMVAQIQGMDAALTTLQGQVDALGGQLDSLKTQLTAIEEQYRGTTAPDDVYRRYDALRTQYNNLVPSYNALLDQYRSQAAQRNGLFAQSEDLRAQTNALVDQYRWVQ